jgi:uncharacterized membrane protein
MAYPTVDAPYGLKPVNLVGGLPFAGATRQIPIGNAYGTSIFNGDVVQLNSSGNVIITTLQNNASPVNGVIGVFLGCSYTNPATKQKVFSQYYPASTAADDILAYISDDPNALYKVVNVTSNVADSTTGGLLPAYVSRANSFGTNAELVLNTGSTTTGNSRMGVFINNVTSSLPFRVVDVVTDSANSSGNLVEFIVKFNAGYHAYNNATGT